MFPIIPAGSAAVSGNEEGIFSFGTGAGATNLVSNAGVVATNVTQVGQARSLLAACEYGEDKGIFFGGYGGAAFQGVTNLVSNAGVVGTDVAAGPGGPVGGDC